MKHTILKTLVGSHAHGLASPESDKDYRGVYVVPTTEILSVGYNYKGSHWLEGDEDNTSYEIGHFLMLALKSNPSILEVFKAPVIEAEVLTTDTTQFMVGAELRALFPYIWNPKDAFNAFVGYGLNQRKKMLDNHLNRWNKYGVAYVRTLINLNSLLETGDFSLEVSEHYKHVCFDIKNKLLSSGEIIDLTDKLTASASKKLADCEIKQNPPDIVNDFLLKVRKEYWE